MSGAVARMTRGRRLATSALALLLVLVALAVGVGRSDGTRVTAYFSETKGIYPGDHVTLLGIPVGTIDSIAPEPDKVKVQFTLDSDVRLPADARAAVVSPALVSVRSIALGPTYTSGPRLTDDAVIPISRTNVPVEWDQVKAQLTRFTEALGPNGANKDGSISELVRSSATFLRGNGAQMKTTLHQLSEAMSTLADNRGNLFATVRNLQVFVAALESSDRQVRAFNGSLARATGALARDRRALSGALAGLRAAFVNLRVFLRNNQHLSARTLKTLRTTTHVLAQNQQGIADILQLAPTTLSNFYNILDPRNGAQTGVVAATNLDTPAQIICAAVLNLNGHPQQCEAALAPLVQYLKTPSPPPSTLPPLGVPPTTGGRQERGGQ
jgi:phospholipid/cholesterol/gamma-HCH transport system substrate-binding protein